MKRLVCHGVSMKPHIAVIVSLIGLTMARSDVADTAADKGEPLATDLWKASGGENWAKVEEVRFAFVVEQEGKELFKAQHVWNVASGRDEVKWKDKDGNDHQASANLAAPASDGDGKTAYGRWTN